MKANNNDDPNLSSSWPNGIVPAGADVAQFDATITNPLTVSLGADTAWRQINFVDPARWVTIKVGNALTLSNNNSILFGTGTANLTLSCNVNCAETGFSTLLSPVGQT